MLKKIFVGTLIAAVTGILIYGAIVRTTSKVEPASGGRWNEQSTEGYSRGRAAEEASTVQAAASEAHEWLTVEGQVIAVDALHLEVAASDGSIIEISNRAWTFIQPSLQVSAGEVVSLWGFYEGDTFEVATITVQSSGQVAALRDEYGRPLWSGRRRN